MNALEFISQLVGKIAWPAVLLIIVFILKKPIGGLLETLRRFKYKDLEMDFLRLAESARNLPPPSPPPPDRPSSDMAIYTSLEDQILEAGRHTPFVAILLGWTGVETAMHTAVARLAISPDAPSSRSAAHNLGCLRQYANLPEEVFRTIEAMRILRDAVAHDQRQRLTVSQEDAFHYSNTAVRLINYLNALQRDHRPDQP